MWNVTQMRQNIAGNCDFDTYLHKDQKRRTEETHRNGLTCRLGKCSKGNVH